MSACNAQGLLLIISGPSGVGKGTILNGLLQKIPDLWFSVSATTRPPRPGEIDGVHYHFITDEAYDDMLKRDAFLEYAQVHTARYGTPAEPIAEARAQGRDVILDIDTVGAANVRARCADAVSIFILPPSWQELRRRLEGRGTETAEQVEKRLTNARKEAECMPLYDYAIVNDSLEVAVEQLYAVIQAEKLRISRFSPTIPE